MKFRFLKYFFLSFIFGVLIYSCAKLNSQTANNTIPIETFKIFSKKELKDKIRGGWAGQTIGVTFGGPTEFRFKGTMIQDYQKIIWHDHYIKETFEADPGLYDDVYLDLTFVNILEKVGLNAPIDSFAIEFANEDYKLWHANQAARYNILNGIMPPASGHWMNNPHADDIDFQIEADFAGMMAPGMTNTASKYCDEIGHIMNYGDGWYGGVFVSAMYTLAYVNDDLDYVIAEALSTIPKESLFYKTIADVIQWHKQYPDDWKQTWFEIEKKHTSEKGCPEGVFNSFNIDARLNAAYVVVGLLYGEKDFFKTMDIATRCGQDSDCNPATAAGILGVMFGYDAIPDYWKPALEEVEDINFPYMDITLNDVYALTYKHSLQLIEQNGGEIDGETIKIKIQKPETVRFEESFTGLYPSEERYLREHYTTEDINIDFTGNGIVVLGNVNSICSVPSSDYVALLDVYIDGEKVEQVKMPYDYIVRKYDIFHKYLLDNKDHHVGIKWVNKNADFSIYMKSIVIYADTPSI
ncbi:ADP-ribosylglycohydrolase family protein [Gelidibacter japonicus]|uniref:ADP-ribosylglycohydrolase family protein n=1 Tax=Gelidibacter japonicus TaxID=1962232 RepID=UPI0013D0AA88|nr:ADP-ribosylglycohydrolase family protein [Gelidibacter japonicus]